VGKSEIVITGPKDALAEAVSGEPLAHVAAAAGPVRSLVREWRTEAGEKQYWSAVSSRRRKMFDFNNIKVRCYVAMD
ncbi:MAG: hypothetical protein GXP04_10260, partial [Alphaproteobacteria bacterium]|nr:hypothetical protein [Alphaproteobacteria bacterium]